LSLKRSQGTDSDTGLIQFLVCLRNLRVKGGNLCARLVNLVLRRKAFWQQRFQTMQCICGLIPFRGGLADRSFCGRDLKF
jgi:hypothetical protein